MATIDDAWNLFFRDLIYKGQTGITIDEFKDGLSSFVNFTSLSYKNNPDVIEYIPLLDQDVAGKYFSMIKKCADELSGNASAIREKVVLIRTTRNHAGTTGYSRLCRDEVTGTNGTLYDYVNYVGSGHHCKIIFDYNAAAGSTPGNISRIVRFKDLSIFFGAGITSHDRILGNFIFDNCKLYFYRKVVFNAADVINSILIGDTGINLELTGGRLLNPIANKSVTVDSNTKQEGFGEFNYSETMPADPTTGMT